MKHLALGAIRLYWRLYPEAWKGSCIFRETCSRHVHRITDEQGLRAGLEAFLRRLRQCRPGYSFHVAGGVVELRLADGAVVPEDCVAAPLVELARKCAVAPALPAKEPGGNQEPLAEASRGNPR